MTTVMTIYLTVVSEFNPLRLFSSFGQFCGDQTHLAAKTWREQDRDGGHESDDGPGSGGSSSSVTPERMTDGDVAISGQQDDEPVVDQANAVGQRIEHDEDVAVDVVVRFPADVAE